MNLLVQQPSETGWFKIKNIEGVQDVIFDYGYEFPKGVPSPAVKIIGKQEVYCLLNVDSPEDLVSLLKKSIRHNNTVTLPLEIFDLAKPGPNRPIDIHKWIEQIPVVYWSSPRDSNSIFSTQERMLISRGIFTPILKRNQKNLAYLWAATLPTPGRQCQSKLQYYETMLFDLHSHSHSGWL